jgi:serine/threonine protein kinase
MELMHWSLHGILHEESNVTLLFFTQLKLMRGVMSALEFLHLQRYIHQDVKPSNILVNKECTIAKLTDFGVTERKGYDTTQIRRQNIILSTVLASSGKKAAGTRSYQAPELILGKINEASRDAEIYSFGVTLWECTTRRIPHENKGEDHIMMLARHGKKLMLPFPLKQFLDDKSLSGNEREIFLLMEKIAYLCLSKYRQDRLTATQVLQYMDGTREFNSQFLSVAPVSEWYDKQQTNATTTYPTNPLQSGIGEHVSVSNQQIPMNNNGAEHIDYSPPPVAQPAFVDSHILNSNDNVTSSNVNQYTSTGENKPDHTDDEEIGIKPNNNDNAAAPTHMKPTLVQQMKHNWKRILIVGLIIIIAIVVAIKVLGKQSEPKEPSLGAYFDVKLYSLCCSLFLYGLQASRLLKTDIKSTKDWCVIFVMTLS